MPKIDWADIVIAGMMLGVFFYTIWLMYDYANLA